MFGKLTPYVAAIILLASAAVASAQVSSGSAGAAQQNAAPPSGLNGHPSGSNGQGHDGGKTVYAQSSHQRVRFGVVVHNSANRMATLEAQARVCVLGNRLR